MQGPMVTAEEISQLAAVRDAAKELHTRVYSARPLVWLEMEAAERALNSAQFALDDALERFRRQSLSDDARASELDSSYRAEERRSWRTGRLS